MRKKLGIPAILTWADLFGKGGRSEERHWSIRVFMAPVEDFCEQYFYPIADFVIAMGDPLYKRALALGIPENRLFSMLHGSDTERMKAISQEEAKTRLGKKLPKQTFLLGYLGYLWSVNADLLFQTVRLVKRSIKQPLKLLLIGNHRIDLSKHLPDDLKVNVIETGWISYEDINLFLCASDVLILPLKHTQVSNLIWPSKLNDYLAAGRPVVATDIQILRPLFQLKNIGYLTEDNPQALSEAVVSVIKQEGLSAIFGANARALAEEELSWEKLIDRLESLYFGFKK